MNQADMMSHHAALETAPRGLMLNQDHLRDPLAGEQQSELRQYRVLLFFTVACFLVYAMLSRPLRRVGGRERRLSKLRKLCKLHTFTFLFSFCYSALSRGHSDTGLYPLPGPATFLTFYFFKRLSISNANAASSGNHTFSQDRASVSGFIRQEK